MADRIEIDLLGVDDVTPVIAAVADQMKSMGAAADEVNAALDAASANMIRAFDEMRTSAVTAADAFGITGRALGELAAKYPEIAASAADFNSILAGEKIDAGEAAASYDELATALGTQVGAYTAAAKELSNYIFLEGDAKKQNADLLAEDAEFQQRLGALATAWNEVNKVVAESGSAMATLARGEGDALGVTGELQDRIDALGRAFAEVGGASDEVGSALERIALKAKITAEDWQTLTRMMVAETTTMTTSVVDKMDALGSAITDRLVGANGAVDILREGMVKLAEDTALTAEQVGVFADVATGGSEAMARATAAGRQLDAMLAEMRALLATTSATGMRGLASSAGDAAIRIAALNETMAQSLGITQADARAYAASAAEVDAFKASVAAMSREQRDAAVATKAAADAAAAAATKQAELAAAAQAAKDALAQETRDAVANTIALDAMAASEVRASAGSGALAAGVGGAINKLGDAWMTMGIVAGAADSMGFKFINMGADFEKSMAMVKSISANAADSTTSSFNKITQTLIDDAVTWGQTPLALSQGLYYIYSAGFHGADAMKILEQAAYGASGGLGSMKDVASAVTTLLTDFGLKGADASRAAGELIGAVRTGKTTIEEFANALGKVAPTAQDAGYGMEGMLASIATLTQSGVKANVAATWLSSTMLHFGAQLPTVAKQAAAMGISLDDVKMKTMQLQHPNEALAMQIGYVSDQIKASNGYTGTAAQKAEFFSSSLFKLLGGIRSSRGALGLSVNDYANFAHALTSVSGATDATGAHFATMKETVSFSFMQIKAALYAFAAQFNLAFGSQIAAAATRLAGYIEHFRVELERNPQAMAEFGKRLLLIVGIINGLFGASLLAAGLKFIGFTDLLAGGGKTLEGLSGVLTKVFGNFGSVVVGPLALGEKHATGFIAQMLKVGSVASMGVAGGMGKVQTRGVGGAAADMAGAVPTAVFGALDAGRGVIAKVVAAFSSLGEIVMHPIAAIRTLGAVFLTALPAIAGVAAPLLLVVAAALAIAGAITIVVLLMTHFRTQMMAAGQGIMAGLAGPIGFITTIIQGFISGVGAQWKALWPQISAAMLPFIASLKGLAPLFTIIGVVVGAAVLLIVSALGGLVSGFLAALPSIIQFFTGILQIVGGVAALVVAIFTGQWGKIPGILGGIWGGVLNVIGGAIGALLHFIVGFVQGFLGVLGLIGPLRAFGQGVVAVFTGIGPALSATWNNLVSGVKNAFNTVATVIRVALMLAAGIVLLMAASIVSGVQNAWMGVVHVTQAALGLVVAIVMGIARGIVGAFQWMYAHNYYFQFMVDLILMTAKALGHLLPQIFSAIGNALVATWKNISAVASTIWNAIKATVENALNGLKGSATASGSSIGNALSATWKNVQGVASVAWNAIKATVENAVNGVKSFVTTVGSSIGNALSATWKNISSGAATAFHALVSTIGNFLGPLAQKAAKWGENMVRGFGSAIASGAHFIWDGVVQLAMNIVKLLGFHSPPAAGPLASSGVWMPNMIRMFVTGILGGVGAITHAITTLVSGIVTAFVRLFVQIGVTVATGILRIVAVWHTLAMIVLPVIASFITNVVTFFITLGARIVSTVVGFIAHVVATFLTLGVRIVGTINSFVASIIADFLRLGSSIVATVIGFVAHVVSQFISLGARVVAVVVSFVSSVLAQAVSMEARFIATINTMVAMGAAEFTRLKAMVVAAIVALVSGALAQFNNLRAQASAVITSLVSTIVGHIQGAIGQVVGAFHSMVSGAMSALSSAIGEAASIGSNIVGSIAGAISGGASRVIGAAAHLASSAISAAKGALGIHSPSTIFAEIGQHTAAGLAQGIDQHAHLAVNATHKMVGDLISAGSRSVSGASVPTAATPLGARLGGGGVPSSGALSVTLNLNGGLGAGLELLNPTERQRFANQIAAELRRQVGMQGIQPLGYSGRGAI